MTLDGNDILYLLQKHGYNYSKVARELDISAQAVHRVATGRATSGEVKAHIEKCLGIRPGTLKISKERRGQMVRVA